MYDPAKTITFWDERYSPNYDLSNYFPSEIELIDMKWPNVEHYYQAFRFYPRHPDLVEKIRTTESTKDAVQIAEQNRDKVRDDWNGNQEDFMEFALRAKYNQSKLLRELLLDTGDKLIVYKTNSDDFWGDGGGSVKGNNKLGKLLMKIREDLRSSKRNVNEDEDDDT